MTMTLTNIRKLHHLPQRMQADLFTPGREEKSKGSQVLQENHSGHGPAPRSQLTWMENEIQVHPGKASQPQVRIQDFPACYRIHNTYHEDSLKKLKTWMQGSDIHMQAHGLWSLQDLGSSSASASSWPAALGSFIMAQRVSFLVCKKGPILVPEGLVWTINEAAEINK